MPQQRRQVLEHDGHADMVDGCVGERADHDVSRGLTTKQPDVAGAGLADGDVEGSRSGYVLMAAGRRRRLSDAPAAEIAWDGPARHGCGDPGLRCTEAAAE